MRTRLHENFFGRYFFFVLPVLLFSSCQTRSLIFWSDEFEGSGKSVFQTYSCSRLLDEASDKSFSLNKLAALNAVIRGCDGAEFDPNSLSDFEKKLYSVELSNFSSMKTDQTKIADLSINDLLTFLKNNPSDADKFAAYKHLRLKVKSRPGGDRNEYVKVTDKMYKWAIRSFEKNQNSKELATIYYEAAQITAKTYWTENDIRIANKVIKSSLSLLSARQSVAEILYLKGRILEEDKNYTAAIQQYDLVLADLSKYQPTGLSFNTDRILWLKSWILYKQKKYSDAAASLSNLAQNTKDLSEKSRALFYYARCLRKLNDNNGANSILEDITKNDFFSYYGLVSYYELEKKFPAFSNLNNPGAISYDLKLYFLSSDFKSMYDDLLAYREFALADRMISLASKNIDQEVSMALYMVKNKNYYLSMFRVFGRLDNTQKTDLIVNYPEAIFPQPFKNHVEKMADKTNLPPSLIYSIMKQESAFNPKARSQANAMGLMQVIPKLAKQLSKKFEVPFESADDLYNPHINIQIGSYELMEQVRKQNGQLTFVAAAYNAGPNALANWLKSRKQQDVLEFIEEIPYDETRTYVKLIARNKIFYERISNRDSELEFPVNFLN